MANVIRKPYVNQGLAALANTDFVTFAAGTGSSDLRTLQTGQAGRLVVELCTTSLVNLVVRETKGGTTRSVGLVSVPGTAEMAVLNIPLDTSGGPSSTITYALQCSGATTITKIQVTEVVGDDVEAFTFAGAGSTLAPADVIAALESATEALVLTCADGGNYVPLTIRQNDVTNNPVAFAVENAGTGDTQRWLNTNTGADGVVLHAIHNSASPADDDVILRLLATAPDDGGNATDYGDLRFLAADVTAGTEDGNFQLHLARGGSFPATPILQVAGANDGDVTWTIDGLGVHEVVKTTAGGDSIVRHVLADLTISSGTQSVAASSLTAITTLSGSVVASGARANDEAPLGVNLGLNWDSTGTATDIIGAQLALEIGGSANAAITNLWAVTSSLVHEGAADADVTTAVVHLFELDLAGAGSITDAILADFAYSETGAGSIDTATAIRVQAFGVGATSNIGIDIGAITGTGALAMRTSSGVALFGDKLAFTQVDQNEYIDSEADGYLDYSATTAHRFRMSSANTDVRFEFIGTSNSGLLEWLEDEDRFRFSDSVLLTTGSLLTTQGSDIASANDASVTFNGNYFDVTGTTQINTLTAAPQAGVIVALQFDGAVTVANDEPGTGASFRLSGGVAFAAAAGNTLMVVYDGTYWREISRTVT